MSDKSHFFTPKDWPSFLSVEYRHDKADPEVGLKEGCTIKDILAETKQGTISVEDFLETLTGALDYEGLEKEALEHYQQR